MIIWRERNRDKLSVLRSDIQIDLWRNINLRVELGRENSLTHEVRLRQMSLTHKRRCLFAQ